MRGGEMLRCEAWKKKCVDAMSEGAGPDVKSVGG